MLNTEHNKSEIHLKIFFGTLLFFSFSHSLKYSFVSPPMLYSVLPSTFLKHDNIVPDYIHNQCCLSAFLKCYYQQPYLVKHHLEIQDRNVFTI